MTNEAGVNRQKPKWHTEPHLALLGMTASLPSTSLASLLPAHLALLPDSLYLFPSPPSFCLPVPLSPYLPISLPPIFLFPSIPVLLFFCLTVPLSPFPVSLPPHLLVLCLPVPCLPISLCHHNPIPISLFPIFLSLFIPIFLFPCLPVSLLLLENTCWAEVTREAPLSRPCHDYCEDAVLSISQSFLFSHLPVSVLSPSLSFLPASLPPSISLSLSLSLYLSPLSSHNSSMRTRLLSVYCGGNYMLFFCAQWIGRGNSYCGSPRIIKYFLELRAPKNFAER